MPTSSDERALFDTNILLHAMNEASEHHEACHALRGRALSRVIDICLTPQVLLEYFAVATNPNELARPLSPAEARSDIRKLAALFPMIYATDDQHQRVFALLDETGFSGRHVFDLQLAATMLANGVARIYSYDDRFDRIPGIRRLTP